MKDFIASVIAWAAVAAIALLLLSGSRLVRAPRMGVDHRHTVRTRNCDRRHFLDRHQGRMGEGKVTREHRRPTPAQDKARARNWKIRCLRSLWAQAGHLTGPRLRIAREMIDFELIGLGAEPEAIRREPPAHD